MRCFILILALMNLAKESEAKGRAGLTGETLSSYTASARASGMGEAFASVADGAETVYFNPAGLSRILHREISLLFAPLFSDTRYASVSYAHPLRPRWAAGGHFRILSSENAEKTNAFGDSLGSFGYREMSLSGSFAAPVWRDLSAGVSLKLLNQSLDGKSGVGFGMDAGLHHKATENFSWGLALHNIFPPRLRLGSVTEVFPVSVRLGSSALFLKKRLLVSADIQLSNLGGAGGLVARGFGGAEYRLTEIFSFRAGGNTRAASLGFGVNWKNFSFDYAASFLALGVNHSAGLSFRFGLLPSEIERRAFLRMKEAEAMMKEAGRGVSQTSIREDSDAKIILVRRSIQEGREEDAQKILTAILDQDPHHPSARSLLAELNLRSGAMLVEKDLAQAISFYQAANYDETLRITEGILKVRPEESRAVSLRWRALAQKAISERSYVKAKDYLWEALRNDPKDEEALILLKRVDAVLEFSFPEVK